MQFEEYPKWLYHAVEPPRIVNDPLEWEALGDGWAQSPDEAKGVTNGEHDGASADNGGDAAIRGANNRRKPKQR